MTTIKRPRIYTIVFARVYPEYVNKAERKGRTKAEVDEVIEWLTGYDKAGLQAQLDAKSDIEAFIVNAPRMNPDRFLITGSICGYKVQEIEDPITRDIRYLDKLIDELAKGKAMEKILRTP